MSLWRVLLPIVVFAAVACTSADVLRLDNVPRPQTHRDSIQLIAQEPTQPYTVIAIVSARSEVFSGRVRARLLTEAAKLGGDAVLLDTSSLTLVGGENARTQLTGKVIVFTKPATERN